MKFQRRLLGTLQPHAQEIERNLHLDNAVHAHLNRSGGYHLALPRKFPALVRATGLVDAREARRQLAAAVPGTEQVHVYPWWFAKFGALLAG